MNIGLRAATCADCFLLAELNRQLIEDEGSRNPMSLDELAVRMHDWMAGAWSISLVLVDGNVAGYCVYQIGSDEYAPGHPEVAIRHFFIKRELRRKGIGRAAFDKLASECLPSGATLTLDVLESNPHGHAFWRALGFQPYCMTYKRHGV